jgi:hypothetical protein
MKANLLKSTVGIVLLGIVGAASATSVPLSETTPPPGPTINPGDTGVISSTSVSGFFSNNYYFDLTGTSNLSDSLTGPLPFFFFDSVLYNGPAYSNQVAIGIPNFSVASLAPGYYQLLVEGVPLTSPDSYSGTLSFTPVPIPASYWLLLSALGGLGLLVRRRDGSAPVGNTA